MGITSCLRNVSPLGSVSDSILITTDLCVGRMGSSRIALCLLFEGLGMYKRLNYGEAHFTEKDNSRGPRKVILTL